MPGYTLLDGFTVKNKLGAASHDELEKLETEPVRYRIFQLELGFGPKGQLDARILKPSINIYFRMYLNGPGIRGMSALLCQMVQFASEPVLRKANGQPSPPLLMPLPPSWTG